jgi:hypothetical protein
MQREPTVIIQIRAARIQSVVDLVPLLQQSPKASSLWTSIHVKLEFFVVYFILIQFESISIQQERQKDFFFADDLVGLSFYKYLGLLAVASSNNKKNI